MNSEKSGFNNFKYFDHYPVMKNETAEFLNIDPRGIYLDMTLGGGSHSLAIAERLGKGGRLVAVDRDADAISFCKEKLKEHKEKIYFVKDNFANIGGIVKNLGYEKISGAVADLGLSTHQIEADRGFSYIRDSALDMRADRDQELTAAFVVNTFEKNRLRQILYDYGEEKYAGLIAGEIIARRNAKLFGTTLELSETVKNAVKKVKYNGGHPAKKTFQAIRIFVNQETENIAPALDSAEGLLKSGGRLIVIAFHSIEDRIVKKRFAEYERSCVCPPGFPVCVCGKKATSKIITRKPAVPSAEEIKENPPSASAKLRVIEKI
jgi:16S rRNA (cytosine1402-N4)-methyltransferase